MTCFIILFINLLQLQQRFDFTMLCLTMSLLICYFYKTPVSCRNTTSTISASTGVTVCYPGGSQVSVHRWSRRQLLLAAVTTLIHRYLTQNLTQICLSQQAGFCWCVGRSYLLPLLLLTSCSVWLINGREALEPQLCPLLLCISPWWTGFLCVCVCVANAWGGSELHTYSCTQVSCPNKWA